jgi:hypothetical protein
MAAKKHVIACNSGGPIDTIANELTGFICKPFPIELLKAMSILQTIMVLLLGWVQKHRSVWCRLQSFPLGNLVISSTATFLVPNNIEVEDQERPGGRWMIAPQ